MQKRLSSFKKIFKTGSFEALESLKNPELNAFIETYLNILQPSSVFVRTDANEDIDYIRKRAIESGEERRLNIEGHTCHFDGYHDQGRDKDSTRYLLPKNVVFGPHLNAMDRQAGLNEMHGLLKDVMQGKELYILFFCLGPTGSVFSIPAVQLTDSSYVAHSEDILYRRGYGEFKRLGKSETFFKLVHSAGVLENGVSKDTDRRRIYIDLQDNKVMSVNTQYGGNTIGLKKLSMRLAIQKSSNEGWLTEHMLIMGVHGPGERLTYFTGAFPSACGKTSTAMLKGETIVGDDIAYLRKIDGKLRAVNVEKGIFGIIRDVNPEDDPLIWEALTSPREVIFSNVLIKDGTPYWLGDKREMPNDGMNYSGAWRKGKKDSEGKEITHSHPNARYTIGLKELANCDEKLEDPNGVEIKGVIYGGRDSDTSVPVQQAFDWDHGILTMGSTLESETTAATLGKAGVRKFNLMSNLDFMAIPLGKYIRNNLEFVKGVRNRPAIFSVNYFLKDKEGKYLTGMHDKRVWVKWMELMVNDDVEYIKTPTGYIPIYNDLRTLFKDILGRDYMEEDYIKQFTLRIPENLAKIDRILKIYANDVADTPKVLFETLEEQKKRLIEVKEKYGDYVEPLVLEKVSS
ncbi:MAG: phosphoenolpyruvate carboxykinase (GTP) [Candidatus Omnitrophica bacterium]|nr:phosphoenolpyruvate carboxykinase (GTP) [Candidatus Omnitrophota bacterium]